MSQCGQRRLSEQPSPVPTPERPGSRRSARAMARLEGEISKTADEYNKRPRKKFVGARTEEYALAAYLDAWKQKIERIGTLNYPEEARGKLYGAVVIFVELSAEDGSLYNAEISKSSGHKVLDQAALRILRMAAPFGPIPPQGWAARRCSPSPGPGISPWRNSRVALSAVLPAAKCQRSATAFSATRLPIPSRRPSMPPLPPAPGRMSL
jgi:TonB family protein